MAGRKRPKTQGFLPPAGAEINRQGKATAPLCRAALTPPQRGPSGGLIPPCFGKRRYAPAAGWQSR